MSENNALAHVTSLFRASFATYGVDTRRPLCVALSGGADSVLLLLLTKQLAMEKGSPIFAIHVHHGIRGAAADRDAAFVTSLCERHCVPLSLHRADAPAYAAMHKCGLEEAARTVRYHAFDAFLSSHKDALILTAHHAGDNLETMLLHLFRGCGLAGLTGIPARRDGFFRPLLASGKPEILMALSALGEVYVTDETNLENTCRRNRLRNEVMPHLAEIFPRPDLRYAETVTLLLRDADFLDGAARAAYADVRAEDRLLRDRFAALHPALASRVLRCFIEEHAGYDSLPTQKQTESVIHLAIVGDTDFRVDLPRGASLVGDRKTLSLLRGEFAADESYPVTFPEFCSPDGTLFFRFLSKNTEEGRKPQEFLFYRQNVYRLLKQIFLSHGTMENGICIRHRKSGDAYRYGGMTHKINTLLSDRKLSKSEKDRLWLLCDRDGILWLPDGRVRDGEGGGDMTLLCYARVPEECRQKGYIQNEDQF